MSRRGETPDEVDDAISEFGYEAVGRGDHRRGYDPHPPRPRHPINCEHVWEPDTALKDYDVCKKCAILRSRPDAA